MLVTIASATLSNWQGPSTGVVLRIYHNHAFTTGDGLLVPLTVRANVSNGLGAFYAEYVCTVDDEHVLTIPTVFVVSTTDSPDNPDATYSAQLWDTATNLPIQTFGTFAAFSIAPSGPTTWGELFQSEANN